MNSIKEVIAANLKRIRKDKGFTQESLAEKTELSMSTIQHLELGNRWIGLETLANLCVALGVNEVEIFQQPDAALPTTTPTEEQLLAMVKERDQRIKVLERKIPTEDTELFEKILSVWGTLNEYQRGRVADIAEALSSVDGSKKVGQPVPKKQKTGA